MNPLDLAQIRLLRLALAEKVLDKGFSAEHPEDMVQDTFMRLAMMELEKEHEERLKVDSMMPTKAMDHSIGVRY
jgi:hypothetical protein